LAAAEESQHLVPGNQLMAIYDKEEMKGSDHKSDTCSYRLYTVTRKIYFVHYHHHHHHISVMELCCLLLRSSLTYPEVSSKVCHHFFCQLGNSVSLPWVIYYEAFYLHVASSFSCIPVICLKFVLFLIPLQFVYLFCNQSKFILLYFSCISSLLLLFFWRPLL
jgi:hypothetical protein